MAFHLSRRFPDYGRIGLSLGGCSSRSTGPSEGRRSERLVDFAAGRSLGNHRICSQCRVISQGSSGWESTGYVHNVVFTCGAVAEPDGTVKIYWGAADTVMCVGEADVSDLLDLCMNHGRPAK